MSASEYQFAHYPSLRDRPVLVSGGGTGIGAAIVTRMAQLGARVAFVDINAEASAKLCTHLTASGVAHPPQFRRIDVTDIDALRHAISAFQDLVGAFRVLVNNAANDQRHRAAEVTPAFWRDRMAVNLDHQFFAAQAVAPAMQANGGGSIVNMGSCSWRLGLGELSVYVTAKAAIEGLTNGLARDFGPLNIRVNCIVPGFIKTERQEKLWLTPELENIVLDGQCLPELIDPGYVANMVAFLASDDARMCSSGTYTVDGGWI